MSINNICYKKNYLTEVIARIDFLKPILSDLKEENPDFSKEISKHFPQKEPEKNTINTFEIGPTPKMSSEEFTIWRYWSLDRTRQFVILPDAIFLTCSFYESYEKSVMPILAINKSLFLVNPNLQIKRIGLRYINNISIKEKNPYSWNKYINTNLLSGFSYCKENQDTTARIFNTIVFNYSDYLLTFKYGIHNPDFPSPIKKKIFVLDFDAYVEETKKPEEISMIFDTLHNSIQHNFENSIKDKLRGIMS